MNILIAEVTAPCRRALTAGLHVDVNDHAVLEKYFLRLFLGERVSASVLADENIALRARELNVYLRRVDINPSVAERAEDASPT